MSVTIFLRFASEADARAMFAIYGYTPGPDGWVANGSLTYQGERLDYAVVNGQGTIWRPTGATVETADGPMPEFAPVPGYHVNLLWRGPEEGIPDFGALRVYPVTPECVFAE